MAPVVSKKNKFKFSYVNAWGQGQKMTLTFHTLIRSMLSASNNYQVTGFNSF